MMLERGYAGMGLRALADRVGIRAASLYHHIESKQQLLFMILNEHMELALNGLEEALKSANDTPEARFQAYVKFHISFHSSRPIEAEICISELRCLEGEYWKKIVRLRDEYEGKLMQIFRDGIADGSFRIDDPKLAAFMVLGAITGVLGWFRSKSAHSATHIAEIYASMMLRGFATPDHWTTTGE